LGRTFALPHIRRRALGLRVGFRRHGQQAVVCALNVMVTLQQQI